MKTVTMAFTLKTDITVEVPEDDEKLIATLKEDTERTEDDWDKVGDLEEELSKLVYQKLLEQNPNVLWNKAPIITIGAYWE